MTPLELGEEELVRRFTGLATENLSDTPPLDLTPTTATLRRWDYCALLTVLTERPVIDSNLSSSLYRAWNAHPTTTITAIQKNTYLAEFSSPHELSDVLNGGPWLYRQDLVAMRRVEGCHDINPEAITHVHFWVQFHNIPPEAISPAGFLELANLIGDPLSPPVPAFINGRGFTKVKIAVPTSSPLKDCLPVRHPSLGQFTVYLSYEKLHRPCLFCGHIGHDKQSCRST